MVSADELRTVMRAFPQGVAVVTVDVDGQQLGLTVTSLVSLSLEPPLIGISISRQAALHELLLEAGSFAVNILASGQEGLAQHFARGVPPLHLWQSIETRDAEGPPQLEGAAGWLVCRLAADHATGDHSLFVGEVVRAERGRAPAALVYADGRYTSV